MDEETLQTLGIKPLMAELTRIDEIKAKNQLAAQFAHLNVIGASSAINFSIHQDAKDATQYIADISQKGLGLPDRDYYLQNDKKFTAIREAYLKHLEYVFTIAKIDNPADAAKKVLSLETRLAKAHWDKVKNRDPVATYNKLKTKDLPKLSKHIDWTAFLDGLGIAKTPAIVVSQPSYITALGTTIAATSLDDWKLYLKWKLLATFSPFLSNDLDTASFAFFNKTLNGQQQPEPRWKRGIKVVEFGVGGFGNAMGLSEAIGKLYVEKHFSEAEKQRMNILVQNLISAYDAEISTLNWMSAATKKSAKEKLHKIMLKIGYPDQWRDYTKLEIKPDDLFGNLVRGSTFEHERNVKKLGMPIDRSEWGISPQTVNAYYNPELNEIVFPAAILQPPFFDLTADDAANYGGIGAVIGHEISHGFDDQGSQYDGDGNLRMWWTVADRKKFEALGAQLAAQYDQYEVINSYKINGKFTLGENIADLGGLSIAMQAYGLSLNGEKSPLINDLTGEQRLFMSWAQVWAIKYRDENLINRIKTDSHSPGEFRANGAPPNIPAFYDAFGVKPGDRMFKPEADRIRIW